MYSFSNFQNEFTSVHYFVAMQLVAVTTAEHMLPAGLRAQAYSFTQGSAKKSADTPTADYVSDRIFNNMSAGSLTTPSKQTIGINTAVLRTNGALSQQQQQVVRELNSTAAPAESYVEAADNAADRVKVKAHYPPQPGHSTSTSQGPASSAVLAATSALTGMGTDSGIANSSRPLSSDESSSSITAPNIPPASEDRHTKVGADRAAPAAAAADAAAIIPVTTSASRRASSSGGSSVASFASKRLPHPAALLVNHHSDRTIMFLVTLVTYPFMFLLMQAAAAAGTKELAGE
jgi:hypothetical protein